ncbi:MAG: cell division protein FtsZ, partial [Candidatus Nanohaloarchaea archaeon]
GALVHVAGGQDLTLNEINDVGQTVKERLDSQAQVIWGARVKDELEGKLQVISIVTGVESPYILGDVEEEQNTEVSGDVNDLGLEVMEQ